MGALDSADQYKIPFMIGVVGHRDVTADEVPQIRAAITQLLRPLRDNNPDVPQRLLCSMAAGALARSVSRRRSGNLLARSPCGRLLSCEYPRLSSIS